MYSFNHLLQESNNLLQCLNAFVKFNKTLFKSPPFCHYLRTLLYKLLQENWILIIYKLR